MSLNSDKRINLSISFTHYKKSLGTPLSNGLRIKTKEAASRGKGGKIKRLFQRLLVSLSIYMKSFFQRHFIRPYFIILSSINECNWSFLVHLALSYGKHRTICTVANVLIATKNTSLSLPNRVGLIQRSDTWCCCLWKNK